MSTIGFYNMIEVNKSVYLNMNINNRNNFQLAHAEFDPEMSFVILILFKEGNEDNNGNFKMNKIGFNLVNSFCSLPEDVFYKIHSVEKTPEDDSKFQKGMINFTIKIELSDYTSPEIVYLTEDVLFKNNQLIDFHILEKDEDINEYITWKPRDTGNHMCKGKTVKGG